MNNFTYMMRNMPPVTKNLIIINVIVWLFTALGGVRAENVLLDWCALHYFEAPGFNAVQLFTYMFMHGSFFHLFFNMFTLFMFGVMLEQAFGSRRFLFYYVTCGIGAALFQEMVWAFSWESTWVSALAQVNHVDTGTMRVMLEQAIAQGQDLAFMDAFLDSMLTVGASGAIFGVLLAFAMIYPNMPTYLFFIPVPVKAKWMVLGYGVIELVLALSQPGSTIAHFAHLGGMVFGIIIILYWKRRGEIHRRY